MRGHLFHLHHSTRSAPVKTPNFNQSFPNGSCTKNLDTSSPIPFLDIVEERVWGLGFEFKYCFK